MTIRIEVTGDTAAQAVGDIMMLANTFRVGVAAPAAQPTPEKPVETKTEDKPVEEKKTKTKKAEPKQIELEDKIAESQAAIPAIDDMRSGLKRLASAKGEDAVFTLLDKYKAKNASTIPEDKRAEVLAEISTILEAA